MTVAVDLIPLVGRGLVDYASSRYIGAKYRNRWWDNAAMVALFLVALWAAWGSVESVTAAVQAML